ncbi:hypothetical protein PF001_g11728 [Phytophthora fragariae]|uniref:DUF6818 domain-containing protein n=1 Tax=Phytophthora fragariae TaxID=53985 RepID=A0A6A4DT70_9STRA|nr:hypothetical protein PF001_g11728 [Phytophthora fragariae]
MPFERSRADFLLLQLAFWARSFARSRLKLLASSIVFKLLAVVARTWPSCCRWGYLTFAFAKQRAHHHSKSSTHSDMIRQTRNPNYTSADVDRLLLLIENELPLGRDEWESLATSYNANRPRGAPERDFESLRRKFKVLYSTRKLTGMPNMPPLVKEAK